MLRTAFKSFMNSFKILIDNESICAIWYDELNNWGDALNPLLMRHISGKTPFLVTKYTVNIQDKPIYSAIGSMLDTNFLNGCGDNKIVIWGTGMMSWQGRLRVRPKKICAVRGPLTRKILLKQGYECPEIFGDPALLYPKYYKPNMIKKYKLGIIPHYIDKDNTLLRNFENNSDTTIINIRAGINDVVDKICSCQRIASSSLHGIIAADAYGIPSTWIKFSEGVLGDGFKFIDYFQSIGRSDKKPLIIQNSSSIDTVMDEFYSYKLEIDLGDLLDVCPFIKS